MHWPTCKRSGLVGRPGATFAVLAVLALLVVSPQARADSSNLLPNGSFQSGTTGWITSDAALTVQSDGVDDTSAGLLAHNTTASTYQLTAKPRPVLSTTAGTIYTANGAVRSDTPGKSVCLFLKEFTSAGANVLTSNACVTATSQWAALPQVTLTAQSSGDQIAFLVKRTSGVVAGESFEVDNLSLVAGGGAGGGSAPSIPTNVSASAISPSEIDVSWTASTDPDPDGVAGYTIYRDGAAALGPVGASTTTFADTSVTPGSTHFYTVAAFDPDGHMSAQSQPSNSVTTPSGQSSVVGLWHLDERSGTTAFDSSGNGHDGTIWGPVTLGVSGEVNTAYDFVPKSAVIVPDAPDLQPGTADVTVSYWVNLTTPPATADYDIFVKGSSTSRSGGGEIKIEIQPSGQASCGFWGAIGGKQLQAGPNVADGQWHHVTCRRTGNQIVQTVDGASTATTKATGAITVTDPVRLGSHENTSDLLSGRKGGDWYNGVLDEVSYTIG